jgi:hypothetical protein
MAEKSSVKELVVSGGTVTAGAELVEVLGVLLLLFEVLGEPLLPQAATMSAALLAKAVAATALVTERKVNHLIFGRDALAPGVVRKGRVRGNCRRVARTVRGKH